MHRKNGFTLIEILVVVLIVGILTVVVLPWLQKAIIRTKYSTLMLPAKAVWEGQEAYYLINAQYASDPADLDLTIPSSGELVITVQGSGDYAYVKASRPGFHNNYILYQKFSRYFPGEVHCEAADGNTNATWLCEEGYHGTSVAGSRTEGFNTYKIGEI